MRALISSLAGASALALLTACGGGGGGSSSSGPTYASSLSYTNPTSGAFQLVKDPASSGGTLVLDLVSTTGTPMSGVAFFLATDPTKVTTSLATGSAFTTPSANLVSTSKLNGTVLQAVVAEKNGVAAPITPASNAILATVTLTLKPNISAGAITFSDLSPSQDQVLNGSTISGTAITVGTLQAQ